MSISEADDCSHDEAAKLVLETSTSDEGANRKKSKERKSVRISDEEITFYPSVDNEYTVIRGDSANVLEGWTESRNISECTNTVEEWTEEVLGNDPVLQDIKCPSLESRDNPFIPGGSLDQEAADILKRATIIRDQFILSDDEIKLEESSLKAENTEKISEVNNSICQDLNTNITEETISPQSVNSTQSLPETKQNGKIEEKTISTDSQPVDNIQKDGTLDKSMKDKKKQKKCCSLM